MSDQNVQSLSSDVVIPEPPKEIGKPTGAKPAESKFLKRGRRAKTVDLLAHVAAKKEAKKAQKKGSVLPRKINGALSKADHKVAVRKARVSALLNKPEAKQAQKLNVSACAHCGKPLTRPDSIAAGIGPECAHLATLLPKGETREKHIEKLTVTELPKGYIKLGDGYHAARKAGYSGHRFMQAVGGNGALRAALNEHFKMIFYKGCRYVPASCLKHLADLKKK